MDTDDLGYLREVVAAGSLSAVARARSVAISTVARRLDAIEAALRLTLVERGRDGVRPTAHGRRILGLAEPLLAEADRLARAADALREDRHGEVVVSATEFVISEVLAPALPTLPSGLTVDLRSQAAVISLAAREADLAVRMAPPQGASLIARRLPEIAIGLFCNADYLDGRDPATLKLGAERLLVYDDSYGRLPQLAWLEADHAAAVVARTNSTRALLVMAAAGAGIALLPAVFARRAGLIAVCPALVIAPRSPWLVTHADLKRQPDVRQVRRWIVDAFATLSRDPEPSR